MKVSLFLTLVIVWAGFAIGFSERQNVHALTIKKNSLLVEARELALAVGEEGTDPDR